MGLARFSTPLAAVSQTVLAFIPGLVGAAAMFITGWFVARIARNGTTALLASTEIDRAAERIGFANVIRGKGASAVFGSLLYWLIMLPVAIASIEALQVNGISSPLSGALNSAFRQVPNVLVALGVLLISVVLGRWVGDLLRGLAETLGADSILAKIGFGSDKVEGRATPSQTIGKIGQVLVVLFGTTHGLQVLGLVALGGLLQQFLTFLPNIALAVAIMGFGFIIGNFVKGLIDEQVARRENQLLPNFLGSSAKLVVVTLSMMAACLQMGLEKQIVMSGFAILFGAAAFAMALAFGLGARETAGEIASEVLGRMRGARSAEAKLRRAG